MKAKKKNIIKTILKPITKSKIKEIDKEGWFYASGSQVMGNYGDIDTFTFCMCRNYQEAKEVARAINVLRHLENE